MFALLISFWHQNFDKFDNLTAVTYIIKQGGCKSDNTVNIAKYNKTHIALGFSTKDKTLCMAYSRKRECFSWQNMKKFLSWDKIYARP